MAATRDTEALMLEQFGRQLNQDFLERTSRTSEIKEAINEGNSKKVSEALKDAVKEDTFDPEGGSSVRSLLNSGVEVLDEKKVGKKIRFDFDVVRPDDDLRGKHGGMTDVGKANASNKL